MPVEYLSTIIQKTIDRTLRERNIKALSANELEQVISTRFNQLRGSDDPDHAECFENKSDTQIGELLDAVCRRLKSVNVTTVSIGNMIEDQEVNRWVNNRVPEVKWNYWDRYKAYLTHIGRPQAVIKETEKSTLDIIERLGDPKDQTLIDLQKGLVLGSVQSGKTANFNGVINRAIDLGYDIIIVLSGIMEDLRSQTQKRIQKDVIGIGWTLDGVQALNNQAIGVGQIEDFRNIQNVNQIESITTTNLDFKVAQAEASIGNQKILVCKKNHSILANLLYWIKISIPPGQKFLNKSVLIIDDEADNASLNNLGYKGFEYATKINGHIRALLNLFSRKSYLGYTATPFANILQDQNDGNDNPYAWVVGVRRNGQVEEMKLALAPSLFPDKFIYKLNPPSDYLGPKQFFAWSNPDDDATRIPLIVRINENETEPFTIADGVQLSKSLRDAIDCFILSIALRKSREAILTTLPGYTPHHSMLIHTSHLVIDQIDLARDVKGYANLITQQINNDGLDDPNGIYAWMHLQWNRFFQSVVSDIKAYLPESYNVDGLERRSFEEIREYLPTAVAGLEVKTINSRTGEKLEYPDGLANAKKYIAIGGNRLSRGFTLEGLTINYFFRKASAYDTLLQMGRWFGYRPGYIDACRLFITKETEGNFDFVTDVLHELELQIESMESQKLGPKQFMLRIKKHPDALKITRPGILNNPKIREEGISYQNQIKQSVVFKLEQQRLAGAWERFQLFYGNNNWTSSSDEDFWLTSIGSQQLIEYLRQPHSFDQGHIETELIAGYLKKCNAAGILTQWKVAIKRNGQGRALPNGENIVEKLVVRRTPKDEKSAFYQDLHKLMLFTASQQSRNIVTRGLDEAAGIDPERVEQAKSTFNAKRIEKQDKPTNSFPGNIFRALRPPSEGLLLIYLMDLEEIFVDESLRERASEEGMDETFRKNTPLIGLALSFPVLPNEPGGTYLINHVQETLSEEEEDIDLEGSTGPIDIQ